VKVAAQSAPARVACVLVPELPAAAQLRAHPELAGAKLAVVSEAGPRATLLSVSPEAAYAGIHPGATLAHARVLCSALVVRVAHPALERAARDALFDVALSASPRASAVAQRSGAGAGEAAVQLDASGLSKLFASETALASALVERARAQGLPAVASVATSRALALLAARHLATRGEIGAICVVAPGDEASFLAPLPVDLLAPGDALAESLTRFGIYRLGALAALAPATVATRLGAGLAASLAVLRGDARETPIAAPAALRLEESIDAEAPLDQLEPLLFVTGALLSRLFARLALRQLACGDLELEFRLCDGGRHALRLRLAAPSSDARVWLRRLRLALERDPPRAPVDSLCVATEGSPARRDQLDLFRPAGPAPAKLDSLLAELEVLCGPGRVGSPQIPDDHHPGAFAMIPFEMATTSAPQAPRAPTLALRAIRPPTPAQVRLDAGLPTTLRSAVANGDVVHCAGPWRHTGGWWSEADRFAFDCFDVATSDGLVVRLRHDRLRDAWHVDAVYD
jgi:protein ImuB